MKRCKVCKHWQCDFKIQKQYAKDGEFVFPNGERYTEIKLERPTGHCRRNPPELKAVFEGVTEGFEGWNKPRTHIETQWPQTSETDWCGKFEPKESEAQNDNT